MIPSAPCLFTGPFDLLVASFSLLIAKIDDQGVTQHMASRTPDLSARIAVGQPPQTVAVAWSTRSPLIVLPSIATRYPHCPGLQKARSARIA